MVLAFLSSTMSRVLSGKTQIAESDLSAWVESPEGFFIRMDGAWAGGLDSRVQLEYPHVVSPCSLGLLTIWWPQGRPVDKGETGWLFMTWSQTPFSITLATYSVLVKAVTRLPRFRKGRDPAF